MQFFHKCLIRGVAQFEGAWPKISHGPLLRHPPVLFSRTAPAPCVRGLNFSELVVVMFCVRKFKPLAIDTYLYYMQIYSLFESAKCRIIKRACVA